MRTIAGSLVAVAFAAVLGAQDQPPPRFRTGVDVVRLDVSVLDRNRRPVKGLTAADFTVTVDGEPQKVVVLSEIDAAPPEKPTAAWMREVAPDVTTNALRDPRLFLIIMDDVLVPSEPATMERSKAIARSLVDQMGPGDLASIVFTANNSNAVDFTADRGRLLGAIEKFRANPLHACMALKYSTNTLRRARETLAQLAGRRTSIVYVSIGPAVDFESSTTCFQAFDLVQGQFLLEQEAMRDGVAQLSNVRIYGVSPAGLVAPGADGGASEPRGNDFLRSLADSSNGLAIVNSNTPQGEVKRIFQENSSYYILGFRPTYPLNDDHIRRLEIRVARSGVEIQPSSRSFKSSAEPAARRGLSPTTRALAGALPQSDVQLRVNVATFAATAAAPDRSAAAVAVTLGVTGERQDGNDAPATIDVEVRVFDPEGRKQFGEKTHRVELSPRTAGPKLYDVVSRFDLKPGRYTVRASAHNVSADRAGSVYADFVVPDYRDHRISLSHVVLTTQATTAAPADALTGVVPVLPTTRREFTPSDSLSGFVRIYQGGEKELQRAALTVRIVDSRERTVFEKRHALEPQHFDDRRALDFRFDLPLKELPAGAFVLELNVVGADRESSSRAVRFRIL
jgi:VWFA-related protein